MSEPSPTPKNMLELSIAGLDVSKFPNQAFRDSNNFNGEKLSKNQLRLMAFAYASGAGIKRLATEFNLTNEEVKSTVSKAWFRSMVADITHNELEDDLTPILKAAALEGIMVIRDLANSETASDAVKLKASQDLVDRYRGKATNHHIHGTGGSPQMDPSEEIKKLEAELKLA